MLEVLMLWKGVLQTHLETEPQQVAGHVETPKTP